jgi:hypothetical protein
MQAAAVIVCNTKRSMMDACCMLERNVVRCSSHSSWVIAVFCSAFEHAALTSTRCEQHVLVHVRTCELSYDLAKCIKRPVCPLSPLVSFCTPGISQWHLRVLSAQVCSSTVLCCIRIDDAWAAHETSLGSLGTYQQCASYPTCVCGFSLNARNVHVR